MKENLRLNPANFRLWANCAGSVDERLSAPKQLPSQDNLFVDDDYTTIGKKLHEYAAKTLKGEFVRKTDLTDKEFVLVNEYVNFVKSKCGNSELKVEFPVFIDEINCYGVIDSWFYDIETSDIHIFDLKTGIGHKIYAYNDNPNEKHHMNGQLLLYALGIAESGLFPYINNFHLYIHQKSLDNVQHFSISYNRLIEWKETVLIPILENIDTKEFNPGPWCEDRHCSKSEFCVVRMKHILNNVLNTLPSVKSLKEINPEEYSELIDNMQGLNTIYASIRQEGVERIVNGERIPGYEVSSPSRMIKAEDEPEVIRRLNNYGFTKEQLTKEKLIGITEIDKLTDYRTEEMIGDLISEKETNKLINSKK